MTNITPEIRSLEDPVFKKYVGNFGRGWSSYKEGKYNPFRGDNPERIQNGITLRTYYDEVTVETLRERFINPMEQSAERNGIFIYSGTMWNPHATISNLVYSPKIASKPYNEVLVEILADSRLTEIYQILKGVEVDYDFLFLGNAIALAVSHIPTQVLEARRQMTQVGKDFGLDEMDYANIYHSTVARIVDVHPKSLQNSGLVNFGRDLVLLHRQAFNNPLRARIDHALLVPDTQIQIDHGNKLPAAVLNIVSEKMQDSAFRLQE